jgi:hypothetical protein
MLAAMDGYIPLARAAALAHERLFPGEPVKEAKALDLLALALSTLLPLYQRDMETGALRALGEDELACGRFARGATTLEFSHRPPLRFLVVPRAALPSAIEALVRESPLALRQWRREATAAPSLRR